MPEKHGRVSMAQLEGSLLGGPEHCQVVAGERVPHDVLVPLKSTFRNQRCEAFPLVPGRQLTPQLKP